MPFFSVIIPVYKVEKFIENCIKSILDQKYQNLEIILIDDGSPDNSKQICDLYASQNKNIKVYHTENEGVVIARQLGVEKSIGDYLVFVDGDDWIDNSYLNQMAEAIKKTNADIICCGAFFAYEDRIEERPIEYSCGLYNRERMKKELFPSLIESQNGKYFTPSLWGKCFKKEVYQKGQMTNCRVDIGEDGACVKASVYNAASILIMRECLYFYRQSDTSITKSKKVFEWTGPKLIGKHLEENIGSEIQIKLFKPMDKNKQFIGILKEFNNMEIILEIQNERKTFDRKNISQIKTVYKW